MTARWLVRALAALLLAGSLAACEPEELDCGGLAGRPVDDMGNTAFLIDVSGSTRSAGRVPDYAAALSAQVQAAVERGDVVSIGTFDGSAATVRWISADQLTRSQSNREKNQKAEAATATACVIAWARTAPSTPARSRGTDLPGALDVAARQTAPARKQRRTVVVATDGLSTTGCTDMSRAPAGDPRTIEAMAASCAGRAGWPAALAGVHLVMIGVGQPAEGQPVLETGHVAWLRQYWERLCLTVGAASCTVSTTPIPDRAGTATPPANEDPTVTFAPGAGPPPPPPRTLYPLPASVLFDTDSDHMRPDGTARLQALAREIPPRARVQVIGYTDSRRGAADNQRLSERRAAVVAAVLRADHVGEVTTGGEGDRRLLCRDERRPDGTWDETCLQRNRRVEVIVEEAGG